VLKGPLNPNQSINLCIFVFILLPILRSLQPGRKPVAVQLGNWLISNADKYLGSDSDFGTIAEL